MDRKDEPMSTRLDGEIAIVTGGGQGIGAAISSRFAAEGARVVIAQRSEDVGAAHAQAIRDAGGEAVSVSTDVAERGQITALVEGTLEAFGPPSILVNNAGIAVFEDPLKLDQEQWDRCFSVDLDAAWWMSQAVLPSMLEAGRGAIVNIASSHSFQIIPGCFPYPVAKHGLIGLTRALAAEYGARGVRINAICPGYIETQGVRDYFETFPDAEVERARVGGLHVLARIGTPDEVAGPALFLVSDDAAFVSGEALVVDGGMTTITNGHGIPFVPGQGPSGVTAGLDTSASGRG
jgi:NAD(P)-dependent dehydrogenase (short-subunit alcohol dehydrogenase family)